MEELRSLKALYEDGYMVESEYNRRRLQLINQITGKNYTLEDILKAENKSPAAPPAAAAAAAPPVATPIQQNPQISSQSTIRGPVQTLEQPRVSSPTLAAPVATLSAPTPVSSLSTPTPISSLSSPVMQYNSPTPVSSSLAGRESSKIGFKSLMILM